MELHGGSVSVQSEGEGSGSKFTMDIPICTSSNADHSIRFEKTMTKETLEAMRSHSDVGAVGMGDFVPPTDCTHYTVRRACSVFPCDNEIADPCHDLLRRKRSSDYCSVQCTSSLNILVVDDVSLNRKMLCRSISSSFHHIAQASDGVEALRHVTNCDKKPDIILMDYEMPNMDGPTATKELRALGYKGMIIGVTGHALPADVDIFLSAGATCVLTKPFRPEELYAAIAGMYLHSFSLCYKLP